VIWADDPWHNSYTTRRAGNSKGAVLRLDILSDEDRQRALRDSIARIVRSADAEPAAARVDAVVSHVEVCHAHGTGVFTNLLFGGTPRIVSIRSRDQHGGRQEFGDRAVRLGHDPHARRARLADLLSALRGCDVRRIVSIPYFREDVANALALSDLFGAPLCTFMMDDNNVETKGIPDDLLRELLMRSQLRLAISPELRDAYEEKFAQRIWLMPPLVPPHLIRREPPVVPAADVLERRRGLMVGNIWCREWLHLLRETVRGAGIELEWCSNGDIRSLGVREEDLAADGIHASGFVPEEELVSKLLAAPYVLVPSGTLDHRDARRGISRFSLPSRIPYVLATAHVPVLVLGHRDTAAARFALSNGVGAWAPYESGAFVAAVDEVADPSRQAAMRARAARLGPSFSSEGAREWIWISLARGRAVDDRWERLVSERSGA
jgi:hypothetical protein